MLFDFWGGGTVISFTPIINSGATGLVTATSNNETQGSANVSPSGESNQYILTATANEGYSFAYWLEEGAEDLPENRILANPYTVTAEEENTYIAYFRDRYTVSAAPEAESKGRVTQEYLGAENGKDYYRFTAVPTACWSFDHWSRGEETFSDNPLELAVGESGQSYIACFTPLEMTFSENGVLNMTNSVTNGFTTAKNNLAYGGLLSSGCRSTLYIPVTIPGDMPGVSVGVRVTDDLGRELADYTESRDYYAGSGYFAATFDPTAADITALTAEITLTTPAGSSTVTKTFTDLSIADGETNNDYRFVTSPEYGYEYVTVTQSGIPVSGFYARRDAVTGALFLYVYGQGGVYAYDSSADVNLTHLVGLSHQSIQALGPAGETGLTCAIRTGASGSSEFGSLTLYRWDGESWSPIGGSVLQAASTQESYAALMIMDADDVWTVYRHWTGEAWETHSYGFKSFQRVSDEEIYATDASGSRWRYDGTTWTQTESVTVTPPDISSVTRFGVNGSSINVGQDQHGTWYLFIQSREHYIDDSGWYGYSGSDVYKWDGSKWVYQIMSDFNDPNDDPMETRRRIRPDGVNALAVPAPGISVMYGGDGANGAIYLSADNVTITFDPGEGTLDNAALGTMTAPILSEIDSSKVPGASRDGYTFGGWFYDEACTIEFDASSTAMPGESITLYAKYSDGNDSEAQLAWYKQKALKDLEKQYKKYSSADYTSENWSALQSAYIDGISAINNATAGTAHIEDNVTAALNIAIAAMQAIEPKDTSKVTVAVSMDANTLGLGYIIEPTLVTVDKGTPVSVVIAELLNERAKAMGITTEGRTDKPNMEAIETLYPWSSSGTPTSGFYLAQVYLPDQSGYVVPDTIMNYITSNGLNFSAEDANGKYLGETDYLNTSGWQYSVGNKTNGAAEFPGIGSSGWSLSDGEVVRWQFTLVGYGADLGADNTAWGTENIVTVGDKSALTWKVAELRSQYSDATLKTYEVYNAALTVLTNAETEQSAIDAALADLNGLVIPVPQGDAPIIGNGSTEGTTENGVTTFAAGTAADAPTVSVAAPEGGWTMDGTTANSFTVSCENNAACVVLVKSADGSCKRLIADNAGTTHTFNTALDLGDELVVVVKGDIDGDGKLTGPEVTQIKAAQLGLLTTFTELQNLVADLDGNGQLIGPEVTQLKAAQLGLLTLTW